MLCCCFDGNGIRTMQYDKRADKLGEIHDDKMRALRQNQFKQGGNLQEIALKKKLSMNKMTAEHEINQIRRQQNEITRR